MFIAWPNKTLGMQVSTHNSLPVLMYEIEKDLPAWIYRRPNRDIASNIHLEINSNKRERRSVDFGAEYRMNDGFMEFKKPSSGTSITNYDNWGKQQYSRNKRSKTKRKIMSSEKPKQNIVFFPKDGQHACQDSKMSNGK